MPNNRAKNHALLHFLVMPLLFLTVALLGGLRVNSMDHAFIFIAPPLVTLILAMLMMLLFVRARLIEFQRLVAGDYPILKNISNIWLLVTLFFASAQTFNSVLPERGLLYWLFSFFFLWTLWNNQFSSFDARRLLRSLAVLFSTAFLLKHILMASLYDSEGGWLKRVAAALLQGVSLGTLDAPAFAPATGYISFFTLALYVGGLVVLTFAWDDTESEIGLAPRSGSRAPRLATHEALLEERGSRADMDVEKRQAAILPSSDH